MTKHILSIRINRRALGAAMLSGDALTYCDGRHLTSIKERAVASALRYVQRLLESRPQAVVCDVSGSDDATTTTSTLLQAIVTYLVEHGLSPLVIGRPDITAAFGLTPLPNRQEVRDMVEEYWPLIRRITHRTKPYAADAAAAALYAQCRLALRARAT